MSWARRGGLPLHVMVPGLIAFLVRLPGPGSSDVARAVAFALAGAVAAAVVALVGDELAGRWGAAVAGLLVALSPIHTLACREGERGALLVLLLAVSLWLTLQLESRERSASAVALGALLGGLATATTTFFVLAVLQWAWLATRGKRTRSAGISLALAIGVAALTMATGLGGFPLAAGVEGWIPPSTPTGELRCAGASFTRLAGLEYHLLVPHARYLALLTLCVIALGALGARRLERRRRWLFVLGVALPFVSAALLAAVLGHVAPLQAHRLLPALPFLAVLVGSGLAGEPGWRRWTETALVLAATGGFLILALRAS